MKKMEMIKELVNSPAYDGEKDIKFLYKNYSKEEIKDLYNNIEEAEELYFNNLF